MEERTSESVEFTRQQKKLPKVDSYYDRVHQAAWIGRTSGLWAGIGLGTLIGGTIGATASYLPSLLGGAALPSLAETAAVSAIFAGAGVMMGTTICADVGVTASAVAAGFEERERRDKLEKLREQSPGHAAHIESALTPLPSEEPASLLGKAANTLNKLIDFRVAATAIVLGAAVGAIFGSTPLASSKIVTDALQGIAPSLKETLVPGTLKGIAASAAVFGALGSVFGLKMSYISNLVTNFTYRILSGKIFDGKETERQNDTVIQASLPVRESQTEANTVAQNTSKQWTIHFAERTSSASFKDLVATTDAAARNAEQPIVARS